MKKNRYLEGTYFGSHNENNNNNKTTMKQKQSINWGSYVQKMRLVRTENFSCHIKSDLNHFVC